MTEKIRRNFCSTGALILLGLLVISPTLFALEGGKGEREEMKKMLWFGSYLQPPPPEIAKGLLEQVQPTPEQAQKIQALYEEMGKNFPPLVKSYRDGMKQIGKAISRKSVQEKELESSLKAFFENERKMLKSEINFWESFLNILGEEKGRNFMGGYLQQAKEKGLSPMPFIGAVLAPLPEHLGPALASFIELKPEQFNQLAPLLPKYVESFTSLTPVYLNGLTSLVEELQKGFPLAWDKIQKKADSLVDTETQLIHEEVNLWKDFNGILTEDQVAMYWPVFFWEKVKMFMLPASG